MAAPGSSVSATVVTPGVSPSRRPDRVRAVSVDGDRDEAVPLRTRRSSSVSMSGSALATQRRRTTAWPVHLGRPACALPAGHMSAGLGVVDERRVEPLVGLRGKGRDDDPRLRRHCRLKPAPGPLWRCFQCRCPRASERAAASGTCVSQDRTPVAVFGQAPAMRRRVHYGIIRCCASRKSGPGKASGTT